MLLSEWDVDVMIRVGDRVCSLGFQCFVLRGYYQTEEENEGTDVSFPTVRKLLIQGKGRKVLESV